MIESEVVSESGDIAGKSCGVGVVVDYSRV